MKNIFRFLMAVTVLFTASCAKEDISSSIGGGEVEVTFTANLPELGTRAYGEGKLATELTVKVFESTTNEPLTAHNRTVTSTTGTFTFKLVLLKGMKYDIVLWAQDPTCNYYELNDKVVTMDYTDVDANDEKRDAFYYYVQEFDPAVNTPSFSLTRPFAQLNAAVSQSDMTAVNNSEVELTTSTVKVKTYTTLNIATGDVDGETEVTFVPKAMPNEAFNGNYTLLSMNYILVPQTANGKMLTDVEFTFNATKNGSETAFTGTSYTDVPLKRNYRTNILGALLTKPTDFEVKIEADFDKPAEEISVWDGQSVDEPTVSPNDANIYIIENPNQLAWLAAAVNGTLTEDYTRATVAANNFAGKTFVLTEDIELGGQEWTPIGSNGKIFKGTFDGQGHTIKNLVVSGNNSNVGLFGVTHDGEIKNFTVQDAKVSGRLNVGVVAGEPYTSKYTNITVKGHVEVNGMAYVGGVGGKNAYADWTNITVEADETSYVKANSVENGTAYRTYVGGVVGFNGEGGHTFSNISSNIAVEGSTCDVGGLFGIAHYGNKFENCVCSGDVTITTDEAENALEMGGIAGVWHNETGYTVTMTDCSFDGELSTPNITEEVAFYYGGLVGAPYSPTGTGKLIIGGKQYVANATQLQAALNAATGESTIYLGADIEGDVTAIQKQGVKITIRGDLSPVQNQNARVNSNNEENKKYNGVIKVHSNSNYYADAALTIKNVNFETSAAGVNVIEALENGSERYSSNITVEDCTFTATGEAVNTSVAVQVKATRGVTVNGCTAINMHSLIQAQSCDTGDVKVVNCTVNGKNGVAFKQVKAATVEGTTITALEYGIRFDGNIDNYGIVVKDNNVTAVQPLIVRKMTGKDNTITLEGTNTLTTDAAYQIVITNGSDDEAYVKPTGTYTLTGAEGYTLFPENPVAKIGNTEYTKINEAIAAWTHNTTLTLLANVNLTDVVTLKSTEHHILNLGTFTLTAASGKNAIEITPYGDGAGTAARSCLTINADATNPGSIDAGSKACVYYKKTNGINDRIMVTINGGIYNGTISSSSNNGGQACPYFVFNGGIFNKSINLTKAMLKVTGGIFHGMFSCTGDSTAHRLIAGGTFKSWTFMTADAANKFTVGTDKQVYNVGVYVNDEGYLVVGGPVITEFGDKFAAKATNATKWSSYLQYSSAATNGLYYTNAEAAIKKHGEANVVLK